jgi:hypothetical protein
MLQALDVLIGFTLVMLIVSMAVTMITQFISSTLLNLRGKALRLGLTRLMALMDQGLKVDEAGRIIDHILRNPLVGQARLFGRGHDLATVIHREELIKLILDFAVPGDAEKADEQDTPGEQALRNKLRASLKRNGISDPEAVLKKVRNAVLALERTSPHLSHSARLGQALLEYADSDYLSKFNSWFDQTVDRVSDMFTKRVWLVTACISLVLAFAVQLDSIALMNRLSVDPELRNQLVAAALKDPESHDPARLKNPAATETPARESATADGNVAAADGNGAEAATGEDEAAGADGNAAATGPSDGNSAAAAAPGTSTIWSGASTIRAIPTSTGSAWSRCPPASASGSPAGRRRRMKSRRTASRTGRTADCRCSSGSCSPPPCSAWERPSGTRPSPIC